MTDDQQNDDDQADDHGAADADHIDLTFTGPGLAMPQTAHIKIGRRRPAQQTTSVTSNLKEPAK